MTTKIDPRLSASLRSAGKRKMPVEAYVQVSPPEGAGSAEAQVRKILQRVERATHTKAVQCQYLDLLDSIHLSASPAFVRELIAQPEVVSASPPPSSRDTAMIEPHNPRRVAETAIDVPVRTGHRGSQG